MSNLKKHKFSDLYDISSGISSKPEQAGHGLPFLSFSSVFNNHFVPVPLPDLMDTSEKERDTYSIKQGDIFLTRTSETLDELAMSSVAINDIENATYSGFLKRLRPKQSGTTYPKFMAFYLRSRLFRKTMKNNAIMTLRASFNEQIFSYLDLLLPKYDEQKNIGDLLFLLEEKIKLNNKINAELEAMAKLIYDYWFVQFDFPDANGKPYKSSGGKMVYNEDLKREIPEGWEVGKLGDWIRNDKTGDWGKETAQGNYTLQVKCIRGADINGLNGRGKVKSPTRYITQKNKHKLLAPYDLIIEISGGSPKQSTGRMTMLTSEVLERFSSPLICSNFCKAISLVNNAYFYNFVYQWNAIYDSGILFGWEGKTSGIKNLLFDSFVTRFNAVVPPEELAKTFYSTIAPIHMKKQKALKENSKLEELRDWLLPMLMNGQVTISND
jgi:type I restriction enzyme S subunit